MALAHDAPLTRDAVRSALRQLPDIARALGRVVAGRGSPRDLGQIRDGLDAARHLRERLGAMADRPELLDQLLPMLDGHGYMVDILSRALVASPPTDTAQGGYIAEGYDAALDVLRSAGRDGRQAIAQLEARYRDSTGVAALVQAAGGDGHEAPARRLRAVAQLQDVDRDPVVLDPFSGRGTTPLQACAEGRIGVGNDLNPFAHLLTAAKADFRSATPEEGLLAAYARGEDDEFVKATCIAASDADVVHIEDGDTVIYMNFRHFTPSSP